MTWRSERVVRGFEMLHGGALGADVATHMAASDRHPRGEGGTLAYLIETPSGSIFWNDSSGHWTGIMCDLRPDVAVLAAVGRGNVDGEPIQGTLAGFIAREVELLQPQRVVLCHHDDWMPPVTNAASRSRESTRPHNRSMPKYAATQRNTSGTDSQDARKNAPSSPRATIEPKMTTPPKTTATHNDGCAR